MNYCVHCRDLESGLVGYFLYCPEKYAAGLGFHAISPVFSNLIEFFAWAKNNKVTLRHM